MRYNFFAVLLAVFGLSGCMTTVPPLDFMVENVGQVSSRKSAEMKSLTVGFAAQSQQGVMETDSSLPPIWKEGLSDAINRSLVFRDSSKRKINLSVRITEVDAPGFGVDMLTKVSAIYEIVDRNSGNLLFAEKIQTTGTVPMDYAFAGIIRARESVNRAVRNNIAAFILKLQAADLSKAVFR
jgi:hypothetical protein